MILEGLVTTCDATGAMHVAAMGPAVADEAVRSGRIDRLLLRPFATSQTAGHLRRQSAGVFHLTDDVLLLARVVAGAAVPPPAARPATVVAGWVLEDSCRAFEFVIDGRDEAEERLRLEARVVSTHHGRPFTGFNRAAHAVLEAAILVTRLHLLPAAEVSRRLADLEPLIRKTGGTREHEAFALLASRAGVAVGAAPREVHGV
jgi:hypothetical protein